MSTKQTTIKNTGRKGINLDITQFFGGEKGRMLQLTQGIAAPDEPGYIQVTVKDAYVLIQELAKWLAEVSKDGAEQLQKEIDANAKLKETIFQEAVNCERFIADLQVLEIPLRFLGS